MRHTSDRYLRDCSFHLAIDVPEKNRPNVPPYVGTHLNHLNKAVIHQIVSEDRRPGVTENTILATN